MPFESCCNGRYPNSNSQYLKSAVGPNDCKSKRRERKNSIGQNYCREEYGVSIDSPCFRTIFRLIERLKSHQTAKRKLHGQGQKTGGCVRPPFCGTRPGCSLGGHKPARRLGASKPPNRLFLPIPQKSKIRRSAVPEPHSSPWSSTFGRRKEPPTHRYQSPVFCH
ncbi:MAG: hypothetical protein FD131_4520 [Rhodocyclaceae bacterium]|nr:MAG: hypothetical protein FD131_4520 [Rhodocyclaceae bacterium]